MTVQKIARTEVLTAAPEQTATRLAEVMRDERVGSLVVVEDGAVIGMVTDRDVALGVWEGGTPGEVPARELMTPDPVTVTVDDGVYDALQQAREASVRRLPVVDGDDLVGIVTLDDIVVLLAGEFEAVSDVIQTESPPY